MVVVAIDDVGRHPADATGPDGQVPPPGDRLPSARIVFVPFTLAEVELVPDDE